MPKDDDNKKGAFCFSRLLSSDQEVKKTCSFQSGELLLCAYTVTADTKAVAARVKRLVLTTR